MESPMAQVRSESDKSACRPVPFIDLKAQFQTIEADVNQAVAEVLTNQAFILGEEVASLETEIAAYCDAREAIGCASGTDALILALMALGIGPGDEVITTPFSFFATASSIVRVGATPIFADIDPDTFNIDPRSVEAIVSPRTKAIMPVHLFGQCADMEPLLRIAARHGLAVIEDACQAIGAEYNGRRAGVLGTIGCFSFFPTKNLGGAGDGGLVTTDDHDLANRIRRLRVHGDTGGYLHQEVGLNSRLDALQAAILRVKLQHLDTWTAARQRNANRYNARFEDATFNGRLSAPVILAGRRHVFNQYVARIAGGHRDDILSSLRSQNVGAAVYYPIPLHLQPCFANLGYQRGDLPVAEEACQSVLALPIYSELPLEDQDRVVEELARAVDETFGAEIAEQPLRRAA